MTLKLFYNIYQNAQNGYRWSGLGHHMRESADARAWLGRTHVLILTIPKRGKPTAKIVAVKQRKPKKGGAA